MTFEKFIAHRYLFIGRREGFVSVISWFSFLGIALGVATLIVVMAVMNGFRQELFGALVSMRGHVTIQKLGHPISADNNLVKTLNTIPGVKLAYPLIEQQAILMVNGQALGVMVQGLVPDALLKRERVQVTQNYYDNSEQLDKAKIITSFKDNVVFMGRRLGQQLNVKVGDTITILTPKSTQTAFGSMPRQKAMKVGGFFHVGMRDFDRNFLFMPIESAQSLFKMHEQWSQIDIFSKHDDLSTALTDVVQKVLNTKHFQEGIEAFDWRHSDASIFHAVKMERNVMFLILTLIILIASFNIITGLTMLVKDKTKDIAILRTIGAEKSSILKIFILTGSFIGCVGTLLGVGLGLSFALNIETIRQFLQSLTGATLFAEEIYFLSTLPAKVDSSEVFLIAAISLVLSFLATLYPAWKAATLNPIEGLKTTT